MKRPTGFTMLAVLLGWLTLAGVGNAVIGPAHGVLRILALAYAVAAGATAFGLWKVRAWAFSAFLAWALVVVLMMVAMQQAQFRIPWPAFFGFACFIVLILALLAFYVRRSLRKIVEQSAGGNAATPRASA